MTTGKIMRAVACLDCDAYFSSIEQRDRPELKGKPVIVGSPPNKRGVVATCSYEARKFGVRSAMASSTAKQKCPDAIFLPPRIDYYRQITEQIMQVLAKFSPTIERVSIDEAFFDLTDACSPASDPDELLYKAVPIAREIKAAILAATQLTVSIGIASNKFLAKVGSDFGKPNGLTVIPERDKVLFLRALPVRTIYGVGEVTEEILIKAGLKTIGDVQDYRGDLRLLVGSWAPTLRKFALGEDDRPLDLSDEVKSISTEETFEQDTDDRKVLKQVPAESLGGNRGATFRAESGCLHGPGARKIRGLHHVDPTNYFGGAYGQRQGNLPAELLFAGQASAGLPAAAPAGFGSEPPGRQHGQRRCR